MSEDEIRVARYEVDQEEHKHENLADLKLQRVIGYAEPDKGTD